MDLGVKIREDSHKREDTEVRLTKGNQKYGMLRTLMNATFVSRKTKERAYKTDSYLLLRNVALGKQNSQIWGS